MVAACRTAPEPDVVVRQLDEDGDGRTDAFVRSAPDGSILSTVRAPEPGSDPGRTLVLAIDAVPWETFRRQREAGRFRWLFPASRLVAPFPSLTDVSFSVLLKTAPPTGYEDRFFDPATNEPGGGLVERISGEYRARATFHDAFDWEEPHLWGGAVFLRPERVSLAELHRLERVLDERRDEDELVVYMGSTDGLGHVRGRRGLAEHLARVDRVIERWLAEGEGSRRVVLFSDHAMSDVESRMFDLTEALERAGFERSGRIEGPDDVVAPAYGLVGSIVIYTACGREEEVAGAVVEHDGADFAVWQDGERTGSVDRRGAGALARRPTGEYPDLERRALEALSSTRNPASVLVSLRDGWHYGSALFDAVVDLAGTHGSARWSSSVGFLASNVDRTPETIAAEDAYPWLGLDREPAARDDSPYRCVTPRASPPSRSAPE